MAARPFNQAEIMRDLSLSVADEVAQLGLRVLTTITLATPVGNPTRWQRPESAPPGYVGGHARRNWQVTSGYATDAELDGVDGSGAATIAAGKVTIDRHREAVASSIARKSQAPSLYVQNAVPYIRRLNDGWSTAAPSGFVEAAVAAANSPSSGATRIEV